MLKYVDGNLITLAQKGEFDVITHGCNCFCQMGSGIAPQMAKAFGCDKFPLENMKYKGDINKLGQIDYEKLHFSNWDQKFQKYPDEGDKILYSLFVVNSYTQFRYGKNHTDGDTKPIDYEALTLCMRKIKRIFSGKRIGLPKIGAGLAKGDWGRISEIIENELKDENVTIVNFKP